MKRKFSSLSRGIVLRFCLFALATSLVFSGFSLMFMYTLEDEFFYRDMLNERAQLQAHFQVHKAWPQPSQPHFSLVQGRDNLPENIGDLLLKEPKRQEFYGLEGRHYHLVSLGQTPDTYLVAEVSELLKVRPLRPTIFKILGIVSLLLTCVACLIAWRVGRHTIQPLTDLAELVDNAEPDQLPEHFAHRFPANEIGRLALRLEQSLSRIRQFVSREQHFTRDASHELRTPVAIVKSSLELLKALPCQEQQSVLYQRMEYACQNMEQSLNTLLCLARESGESQLSEPLPLLAMVESTVVKFAHLLEGKDVEVHTEVRSNARLLSNRGIVDILLANLISNAFQYTQSGHVKISWVEGVLEVADSGPGIEEHIRPSVLESDVKGQSSQGLGLGLSIVRRLCEQKGLKLVLSSDSQGTCIQVHFSQED